MKHIKLFENGYTSSDEYEKIIYRRHDCLGASEVAGLTKKDYLTPSVVGKIYELFKNRRITINNGMWINILINEGSVSIYSFFDEWYLVSKGDSSNTYYEWYKCDQDDQLESLLKNYLQIFKMIHLKRFNENIEESFFEMNEIEFYDRRDERTGVDMSQRTADDILSHISLEGSLHEMWESKEHYLSLGSTSRILKNGVIQQIYGSISETDDEWFWLWLHFRDGKVRCFKCDQLEGVFDCLKMLMLYEDKTI